MTVAKKKLKVIIDVEVEIPDEFDEEDIESDIEDKVSFGFAKDEIKDITFMDI